MKNIVALLGVCLLLSLLSITPAFAAGPYTVVLDGLQSPRGLAFVRADGCTSRKRVREIVPARSLKSEIPGRQIPPSKM